MPAYEYECALNGLTVEVVHGMDTSISTWGELCTLAGMDPGETPPEVPVRKLMPLPGISTPTGDTKYKEMGFTKLVRRDQGVYENVTATSGESRYMRANDPSTMPHLHKKIED
jgi:hypothetical protein